MAKPIDEVFNYLKCGTGYDRLSEMNQIKVQMNLLFLGIANSRYDWKGLPKEVPSWCLEKVLNLYGQGVLFKVGEQYLFTSATNTAELNPYGEPCEVTPVSLNGMSFDNKYIRDTIITNADSIKVVKQDAVLIKNNLYSIPTYWLIKPFIEKLCFIWESMGINAGLSRVVALVHCNKDVAGVVRSEINKILGGTKSGIAVVNEKMNTLETIEKLDLKVEYTPDKYWLDFDNTFNLICELVGLTTDMNKAKKERVLVSQVESNDELTKIVEDTYLEYRKLGAEEMKSVFGLSVEVDNKKEKVTPTSPQDMNKPKEQLEDNSAR